MSQNIAYLRNELSRWQAYLALPETQQLLQESEAKRKFLLEQLASNHETLTEAQIRTSLAEVKSLRFHGNSITDNIEKLKNELEQIEPSDPA
jgi:hypothetical protein